jgi:hypothetical protein
MRIKAGGRLVLRAGALKKKCRGETAGARGGETSTTSDIKNYDYRLSTCSTDYQTTSTR